MTCGIYFHIPFCKSKCSYCHFISVPLANEDSKRYLNALLTEMERYASVRASQGAADSVYFGGGTPSLFPEDDLAKILSACRAQFKIADDCEISLEANPGTLSAEKVRSYRGAGITRVSLGAQSFNDEELKTIDRLHNGEMIMDAVVQLRNGGFSSLNIDLMLGLPGQTAESWRRNLKMAMALEIPHLSVYMLDLDDECPMSALVESGSVSLPEEDLVSDLYLETIEFLASQGYYQYEISNFALPGYTCRHNMKYWSRQPVFGFGVGSHSFDGATRYCNHPRLDQYMEIVLRGGDPVSWREVVSERQSLSESLFLGLRLRQGVDWNRLRQDYHSDCLVQFEPGMQDFTRRGLIEWNGSTVRLTKSGMLLSNEIFQLFI